MAGVGVDDVQELLLAAAERLPQGAGATIAVPRKKGDAPVAKHQPYVQSKGSVAQLDKERVPRLNSTSTSIGIRKINDPVGGNGEAKDKKATAGPDWYGLPKTVQTPELARDLKLLANRNVLDTHRHYKKESPKSAFPQFSQIGTVVEGATEFFSARIARRERKQTLAEDLLAGEKSSGKFNSKFQQLQAKKASGRDRHKHMKSKFKSKR